MSCLTFYYKQQKPKMMLQKNTSMMRPVRVGRTVINQVSTNHDFQMLDLPECITVNYKIEGLSV